MSTTKVAFPPPPPTSNTLTVKQRHQLLRSTKKLGQLLGSTPHVLDESYQLGPLQVQLPFRPSKHLRHQSLSSRGRSSMDTVSSTSSTSQESSTSSSRSGATYSDPLNATETWHLHYPIHSPPLLRLARNLPVFPPPSNMGSVKRALETVPASPLSPLSPPPSYAVTEDISYTLSISRRQSTHSLHAEEPSFTVPSDSSVRRQKMDRLKRKLGGNVPVGLVYPPEETYTPPPPPPPAQTHQIGQKRLTVHYGPPPSEPKSETREKKLNSITEGADERGAKEFSYPPAQRSTEPPSVLDEVDVDIDAMFMGLVRKLTGRKRPLVDEKNEYSCHV